MEETLSRNPKIYPLEINREILLNSSTQTIYIKIRKQESKS